MRRIDDGRFEDELLTDLVVIRAGKKVLVHFGKFVPAISGEGFARLVRPPLCGFFRQKIAQRFAVLNGQVELQRQAFRCASSLCT